MGAYDHVPNRAGASRLGAPKMNAVLTNFGGAHPKAQNLEAKMNKLTNNGTETPTGRNLKKYNKAADKIEAFRNKAQSKVGYGTNTQSKNINAKANVKGWSLGGGRRVN